MSLDRATGALLIGLPIAFNVFFLLGRLFEYPAILRSPVGEVLSRFRAGGLPLKLVWYGFMLTAVLLAPLAVLLGQVLAREELVMIAAGVNARALTAYMGHASVTTTYDRYGHLMPGNEDEAAALLDADLERANTRHGWPPSIRRPPDAGAEGRS